MTHELRHLLVLAGWEWFKHYCSHVQCWTARGEKRCACGMYALTWEGDADANSP